MRYIKLFEQHTIQEYSIYDIITMPSWKAIDIIGNEIKKNEPDFRLIEHILEHSLVDINEKDKDGMTLLYIDCTYNKPKIVKMLFEIPNIDVNTKIDGETALHRASVNGYGDVVRLLLERPDIDINAQEDNEGWTALMWASYVDNNLPHIVELLLQDSRIDVNVRNIHGESAWDWADADMRNRFPELKPTRDEIY